MTKTFLITAGVSGFITILLGAVGSHLLSGNISSAHLTAFNIAIKFEMYHTLALLALAFAGSLIPLRQLKTIYFFFLFGILLFSFSIYLTSTMEISGFHLGLLHVLPPFGGVSFMLGWIWLIWAGITHRQKISKVNQDKN